MKKIIALAIFISSHFFASAQKDFYHETFTHSDTLRGTLTPERAWWDVLRYDITVKPDYVSKTIQGSVVLSFRPIEENHIMQIDLQPPLIIDSVIHNNMSIAFKKADTNVCYVDIKKLKEKYFGKEPIRIFFPEDSITIYYHGKPQEAIKPPWDNGWIWTKDSLGRPWMTVTSQGLGASAWYPCKDYQGDEPDSGASLTVIVPDTLVCVGNGRLQDKRNNNDGTETYKWAVKDPINNYDIVPYIGKYVNFSEVYKGEKGNLDVNYWVLDYNIERAKTHIQPDIERMLKAFEYWMGPYPFYEDGYKIVEAPYLGMEHQSAIAYGNKFRNGYRRDSIWIDRSKTGWGLKWDFIIVHESGHEWFGNNITTKDLADMWVHEGFTTYSEALFTEYYYGKEAGSEYNFGQRNLIKNDEPIIGHYGVNDEGSADEYDKGSSMINIIRNSMNDDEKFRNILRGLNKTFYHQTVTTKQIEDYVSQHAGFDYSKLFDQYLRTTQIPQFEFYFVKKKKKVFYRWDSCIAGFDLPLVLKNDDTKIRISPTQNWQNINITSNQIALFNPILIEKMYYLKAQEMSSAKN
jgi:aminopeptidase N